MLIFFCGVGGNKQVDQRMVSNAPLPMDCHDIKETANALPAFKLEIFGKGWDEKKGGRPLATAHSVRNVEV